MPATKLTATNRFIAVGVSQYYWVATIADPAAPIRTELDAGTDLTGEVSAVAGFTVSTNQVAAPDFASRFTSQVPGAITAADSTITFYRSEDSTDVRTLLTRDLAGFIVIFPEGDVSTRTMDVWPVKVSSVSKSQDNSNPATIDVSFSITAEPSVDIAVP